MNEADMTDAEIDKLLERFDQTEPLLQRRIVARFVCEVESLREEVVRLRQFKAYVHARLDAAGVPADPESPHKAEGCRIGGRLDIVLTKFVAVEMCLAVGSLTQRKLRGAMAYVEKHHGTDRLPAEQRSEGDCDAT